MGKESASYPQQNTKTKLCLSKRVSWANNFFQVVLNRSLAAIRHVCQSCKGVIVEEGKLQVCSLSHSSPTSRAWHGASLSCTGSRAAWPSHAPSLTQCRVTFSKWPDWVTRPCTITLCYCCCAGLRHPCNWSSTELQVSEFTLISFLLSQTEKYFGREKITQKEEAFSLQGRWQYKDLF